MKKLTLIALGAAALSLLPVAAHNTQTGLTLAVDSAEARIGRPLTPGSVAGVNRRVHRRAYRHAAYGAAAYGAYRYGGAYAYPSQRHCRCY